MIHNTDSKKDAYYVSCANWECMVKAIDPDDAVAQGLEKANDEFGKNLNLSPSISVMNISSIFKKMEVIDDISFVYTPDALANVGMYDLSKKYNKIIGLMKEENES
ncbi:MAG: hypothetical protein P8M67_04650 [Opitutales bacterium]|nr:hypothetical protein [Opitutales bacterium]